MVSQNGTVGYTIRKIQAFDYPLDRGFAPGHAFRRPGHALEPRIDTPASPSGTRA